MKKIKSGDVKDWRLDWEVPSDFWSQNSTFGEDCGD